MNHGVCCRNRASRALDAGVSRENTRKGGVSLVCVPCVLHSETGTIVHRILWSDQNRQTKLYRNIGISYRYCFLFHRYFLFSILFFIPVWKTPLHKFGKHASRTQMTNNLSPFLVSIIYTCGAPSRMPWNRVKQSCRVHLSVEQLSI